MKKLTDYKVLSIIGSGSFGTCYKVENKLSGDVFVWKAINYDDFDEDKKDSLVSEINLLRKLKHPHIVEYYDHIVNKDTKTLYIIMECCQGGDLSKLIIKCRRENLQFEEVFVWRVLYQTCSALQMCHNKMPNKTILHRDIKPANIFLDMQGNVKLGDFGLARILKNRDSLAETLVGTPYYMSPEIVKGKKYDWKSDIWALGCLTYEICSLRPPFMGCYFEQLSNNITNGQFNRIPSNYSTELQEIISLMLNVNRDFRPSIEVILRHPSVVNNVSNIEWDFPKLIPNDNPKIGHKLCFSPTSDRDSTLGLSLCDSGKLSLVSTPVLRSELFGTKVTNFCGEKKSHSHPELNNISDKQVSVNDDSAIENSTPNGYTQNVFDGVLKRRLQDIRVQETILKQKEKEIQDKEDELYKRAKHLQAMEKAAQEKYMRADAMLKKYNIRRHKKTRNPPVKNENNLNDTYCSIESNDNNKSPTIAKLNLDTMQYPLRKVTFKSPQKLVKYNIEITQPKVNQHFTRSKSLSIKSASTEKITSDTNSLGRTTKSNKKTGDDEQQQQKRRSIFSIFGKSIKQNNKSAEPDQIDENKYVMKFNGSTVANKWTDEYKKAAFQMLAAMNAADLKEYEVKTFPSRAPEDEQFRRSRHRRTMTTTTKREFERMIL